MFSTTRGPPTGTALRTVLKNDPLAQLDPSKLEAANKNITVMGSKNDLLNIGKNITAGMDALSNFNFGNTLKAETSGVGKKSSAVSTDDTADDKQLAKSASKISARNINCRQVTKPGVNSSKLNLAGINKKKKTESEINILGHKPGGKGEIEALLSQTSKCNAGAFGKKNLTDRFRNDEFQEMEDSDDSFYDEEQKKDQVIHPITSHLNANEHLEMRPSDIKYNFGNEDHTHLAHYGLTKDEIEERHGDQYSEQSDYDDQYKLERKTSSSLEKAIGAPLAGLLDQGTQEKYMQLKGLIQSLGAGTVILHPYSVLCLSWDIIMLFLNLLNCLYVPYAVTFVPDDSQEFWGSVKFFFDMCFLFDCLWVNFHIGIIRDGPIDDIVFDPAKIRSAYMTWTGFGIDIISSLPFEMLFIEANWLANIVYMNWTGAKMPFYVVDSSMQRKLRYISLLRFLRMFRLRKVRRKMEDLVGMQVNALNNFISFSKIFVHIIFFAHLSACINFFIPMINDFPPDSWPALIHSDTFDLPLYKIGNLVDPTTKISGRGIQYKCAFFKSISQMMTIGYGQTNPRAESEIIPTMICMLIGAMMFGIIIGNISATIETNGVSKRQYKEKVTELKEYMSFRKFPLQLRFRLDEYYEARFQGKMFNEDEILSALNPVLREELINHNCCELIDSVPFFKNADADFLSSIISCLKFEVYLNGDCIIEQGTVGDRMYFIGSGSVVIRHSDLNEHGKDEVLGRSSQFKKVRRSAKKVIEKTKGTHMEQRLSDGAYFGEMCLLASSIKRVASVYADSQCNCYALEKCDFDRVLTFYPGQRQQIQTLAETRMMNNTALQQQNEVLEQFMEESKKNSDLSIQRSQNSNSNDNSEKSSNRTESSHGSYKFGLRSNGSNDSYGAMQQDYV